MLSTHILAESKKPILIHQAFHQILQESDEETYFKNLKEFRNYLSQKALLRPEVKALAKELMRATLNTGSNTFYFDYLLMLYTQNNNPHFPLPTSLTELEIQNLYLVIDKVTGSWFKIPKLFTTMENFKEASVGDKIAFIMQFVEGADFVMEIPVKLISRLIGESPKNIAASVDSIPTYKVKNLIDGSMPAELAEHDWNAFSLITKNGAPYIRQWVRLSLRGKYGEH